MHFSALVSGDAFASVKVIDLLEVYPMLVRLNWEDPVTGEHLETISNLPVALGSKQEKLPTVLEGQPVHQVLLKSKTISRFHALINFSNGQLVVTDRSTNGIYLNDKKLYQSSQVFHHGDTLKIGPYTIIITLVPEEESFVTEVKQESSFFSPSEVAVRNAKHHNNLGIAFEPETDLLEYRSTYKKHLPFSLPGLFNARHVSVEEIKRIVPSSNYEEKDYAAVGGGMGSFAWVNTIRVCGAKVEQIRVVGRGEPEPYHRYRLLCKNSQIPEDYERIRSNSDSCPDNIWGFPGYALREAWNSFFSGNIKNTCKCLWQVFAEPLMGTDTYTPIAGNVYKSLDREAKRIGWRQMWHSGEILLIRKTDNGCFVIVYRHSDARQDEYRVLVAKYVHLAIGYASVQFLPDLLTYRKVTGDIKSVVNAYENHQHIYQHLKKHGGIVIVRGRGIVASRIIQALNEARKQHKNHQVTIIHLMRAPNPRGTRFASAQRYVENHWEFQPFNWPKAAWGGDMRKLLELAKPPERYQLLQDWGGTTTADRSDWRRLIDQGRKEGWYQIYFGQVERVERNKQGKLDVLIAGNVSNSSIKTDIPAADFMIDATGLDANPSASPLIDDLIQRYEIPLNPFGRLDVANDFELRDMRSKKKGRMYAAGSMTLGASYAPVDSFLGLQYAAQRSAESLARIGAPGIKYFEGLGSVWQWLKWASNQAP